MEVMLINVIVGGVSAAVSKTAAAPIERVKLLIQNQVSRAHASSCPLPWGSQRREHQFILSQLFRMTSRLLIG